MKATTRFLAFVFAAVMLLSLASCADNQGNNNEITTAPEATVEGEVTEELYLGYEKDKLPTDLTYNNESVKVLYWSDAERKEFEIKEDEDDSDRIVSAIKARNEVVQQRLGITFDWDSTKGNSKNRAEFTKYVETQFNGGNYYDIIATYSRTSGMLATRGFLMDLNTIENNYIDYEQNWWPATIIDVCTIAKSLYFVSGDISTNTLHFMYGIYFNKELIADRQLEDPQTLVKNGTWTIGKLIEMTSDTYEDRDNSNSKSVEDFYGFCTLYFHCDAFYTGSELRLVDNDEDNVLIISPDFSSEKAINLVDQLGQWLTTDSCYFDESSGNYQKPFVNGTALFCQNRVYMADAQNGSGLNAVTWKYGIVPTPKYNEDQTDYITVMGNPFTLYGVGNGCDDPSRATAVIECWASEAYRRTTPAIFEVNMKLRYAKDDVDSQMFDILRATCCYDLGRIFSDALSYMSEMPSKVAVAGTSWSRSVKSQLTPLKNAIKGIVSDLEKNANLVR